ncbi:MAG: 4-hydroxybenzoate octaprenyltransferase [Bdellovibrionales bacterium]
MTHTDIRKLPLIERLPEKMRPFLYLMRLDRPIGTWLLLMPSLWSIALAGGLTYETVKLALLFGVGALIMRGAGCVVNDLWDQDLDKKVERTKTRPLASGAVTTKQALAFLGLLLGFGLLILLQMNMLTIQLGAVSLLFVIVYPLMKRVTWWPQAFLGLTFNFGALMGWSAVTGAIELPAILLYVGGFFWTMGYDTIYAHQDKEDDELVGIKSTARLFGSHSKKWLVGFYALCSICLLYAVLLNAQELAPWALFPLLPAFALLVQQLKCVQLDDPVSCLKTFRQNRIFGALFLVGILLTEVMYNF